MTPRDKVLAARERADDEDRKWRKQQQRLQEQSEATRVFFDRDVRPCLIPATPQHYSKWLAGYLEQGGKVSSASKYPMPRDWFVAVRGFTLMPLYGAQAINIIVPEHVTVICPDAGHSTLYLMDGFRTEKGNTNFTASVPVFSDTEV